MILNRTKKLWRYFSYFIRAKYSWRWPRPSDVLIFDACNQDVILEYLHPWRPEVLHVRGEQINMLVFLASIFRGGRKLNSYIDCFIERARPRLIVTFIDNNLNFFAIRQRHPKVKTLLIQNGWRAYCGDILEAIEEMDAELRSKLAVDYMLFFGSALGARYTRHIAGTSFPMGSIKNNLVPRTQPLQQGLIAFASQWHKDGFYKGNIFYTQEEFFGQTDRPIIQCLGNYAEKKNKQLVIIPRNGKHDNLRAQEEDYFRRLLGKECVFLEPQGLYPSYQALDAADVVVAVDSTLGYESIARGKKTAIFSIRGNLLGIYGQSYGWPGDFPDEGPFWTNTPDSDTFVRILDYLFEVDDAQWLKDVAATNFPSLMIYDPGNSILNSILEKELGPAPISQG